MKAFTKSLQFMGAIAMFLALAACGKNDSNNNNNVAAVQYGMQNNQCYDITHNTPVAYNYCQNVGTTTGQFQYVNNQCINTQTNTAVDPQYCQQAQQYGQGGYNQGYPQGYPYNQGCNQGGYNYSMGAGYAYYYGANYGQSSCGGGTYGGATTCSNRNMYRYDTYTQTAQLVYCDAYSCRGQFLYDISTRVRVYCQ